jgi:flagellar protein FliO/FliZ
LAVIAITAALGLYASKRWARQKDKGGQKARIEMMHQYHLGPRKSLALIRVSGEAMLVGVTDHNINMIKAVTLIDDELEDVMGKDFNNFLEDEFSIEDVRGALGPRV